MDEVLGDDNFISMIQVQKTGSQASNYLANTVDFIVWYARSRDQLKFRALYAARTGGHVSSDRYDQIELPDGSERRLTRAELTRAAPIPGSRIFQYTSLISAGAASEDQPVTVSGHKYRPPSGSHWKTTGQGLARLDRAGRVFPGPTTIRYKRLFHDFAVVPITERWESLQIGTALTYVVQTSASIIQRCLLMASDPGDLILDPTCGSGTTAYVAEQWGRRWITMDTSRVALALARARIMGARYPYYLLADSRDGQQKEAEITRTAPSDAPAGGDIRQGFVYERVAAHHAQVHRQRRGDRRDLGALSGGAGAAAKAAQRGAGRVLAGLGDPARGGAEEGCPEQARELHAGWWERRIARQKEIDAAIAAKADLEYLYDKPYVDNKKVRVAGPFTVESVSPHRVLGVDENDELIDNLAEASGPSGEPQDFASMILENLKSAGVQQAHVEDRIGFASLTPWPGDLICAEGRYVEGPNPNEDGESSVEKRAAIFIGPEFGTVSRPDLVQAAREAGDADFDVLIACAFSYEAHASELDKLGRIPVLKARMNADLHMAGELKNTGKGNLFVIFGEPDIDILDAEDGQVQVRVNGVDVFHPNSGEVCSDGPNGIACWFIDTDYNEESFFVRQAYFLGQNDPYKALKTTLKAEINEEA